MSQPLWEVCELVIEHLKYDKKKGRSYSCWIWFHGSDGASIYQELATLDKFLQFNPWHKALGLLSGNGWELVSVQHANGYGGDVGYGGSGQYLLLLSNRIAYLKRLVIPGRPVNEPKLAM